MPYAIRTAFQEIGSMKNVKNFKEHHGSYTTVYLHVIVYHQRLQC